MKTLVSIILLMAMLLAAAYGQQPKKPAPKKAAVNWWWCNPDGTVDHLTDSQYHQRISERMLNRQKEELELTRPDSSAVKKRLDDWGKVIYRELESGNEWEDVGMDMELQKLSPEELHQRVVELQVKLKNLKKEPSPAREL